MTNRTVKFHGQGFGNVPVTITVTANGNIVFQGPIPTLDQPLPPPRYHDDAIPSIFEMPIPLDFIGTIPMSVVVESGLGIAFLDALANYNLIPNPIYTPEQFAVITAPEKTTQGLDIFIQLANPALSSAEIAVLDNPDTPDSECNAILANHGLSLYVSGGATQFNADFCNDDSRLYPALDGNPLPTPVPRPSGLLGDWTWIVPVDSTFTYQFSVEFAGVE